MTTSNFVNSFFDKIKRRLFTAFSKTSSNFLPEGCAVLGLIFWLTYFWHGPFINDLAWQLWIANEINRGAHLYVDIYEVNPPLWFWFGSLIQKMNFSKGLPAPALIAIAFVIFATASIFMSRGLIATRRERALLYTGLLFSLFITASYALGQREQFTLIVTLPYIVLIAKRAENSKVNVYLAVLIGIFSALGIALKHYFILLPIIMEVWLAWNTKKFQIRPELLILFAAGIAYWLAIIFFSPEYLSVIVPLIILAYDGYDAPLFLLLYQIPVFSTFLALAAIYLRRRKISLLASAFSASSVAFAAAYLMQSKGFPYQGIPALGAAIVSLIIGFGAARKLAFDLSFTFAALALIFAFLTPYSIGAVRHDQAAAIATEDLPPSSSIVMLSASGAAAWPLVQEKGFGWPSRHMTLWMMASVWPSLKAGEHNAELRKLAKNISLEVANDIHCSRPEMVLVDTRYDNLTAEGDIFRFFQNEPKFALAMKYYERRPDVKYLRVYVRAKHSSQPDQFIKNCLGHSHTAMETKAA